MAHAVDRSCVKIATVPVRQHDHAMLLHIRQDAMYLRQIASMLAHRT